MTMTSRTTRTYKIDKSRFYSTLKNIITSAQMFWLSFFAISLLLNGHQELNAFVIVPSVPLLIRHNSDRYSDRNIKNTKQHQSIQKGSIDTLHAVWYDDNNSNSAKISQQGKPTASGSIEPPTPTAPISLSENTNSSNEKQYSAPLSSSSLVRNDLVNSRRQQYRDVVIVGGGLAGLSAALYLSQLDPTRQITIIDREDCRNKKQQSSSDPTTKTAVASMAAAGMLAPSSERLPKGHLLDLCYASRRMYRDYCEMVETMAQESGEDGLQYLNHDESTNYNNLQPWSVGYVASGGFLAPAFAGDAVATWAPPDNDDGTPNSAIWLDPTQVRELEPNLHPDVIGGWWFPEDASVDARRLTASLRAACAGTGNVQFMHNCEVSSLDLSDGTCHGLWIKNGKYIKANTVLVANGAWMRTLLPVPILPHKGQSLSLKMPSNQPPILRRVLFAQDCYITPKADGTIIVGATVEAGSYDSSVTPAGVMHILHHALQLVPALANLPLVETWAGLRPTTPDKGPLLGKTMWKNLFLAGGYWRNGVLLAPKTGWLLGMLMSGKEDELSPKDKELLDAFAWDRFTSADKASTVAASSRYAASMYPVHTRSTAGISAAVGTELGSYSTARSAGSERAKDRDSLFSGSDNDDAFERAAAMGIQDGVAYTFSDMKRSPPQGKPQQNNENTRTSSAIPVQDTSYYEGTPDALTIAVANGGDEVIEETTTAQLPSSEQSMNDAYEIIKANKAKLTAAVDKNNSFIDERPDPGYRIYHVDSVTGEHREVPPYTSPGDFLASLKKNVSKLSSYDSTINTATSTPSLSELKTLTPAVTQPPPIMDRIVNGEKNQQLEQEQQQQQTSYDETMYDGYQEILKANSRNSRADELAAMKEARRKNREGQDKVDISKIGVYNFTNPNNL